MKPFYGKEIDPKTEQRTIQKILSKFCSEPVSEDLKKKIYEELTAAKHIGKISIPFKIVMRKFPDERRQDYIEIILDTKV